MKDGTGFQPVNILQPGETYNNFDKIDWLEACPTIIERKSPTAKQSSFSVTAKTAPSQFVLASGN